MQGETNTMMQVPTVTGVCAIILLGLALSACGVLSNGGGNSDETGGAFCQPGICVGSTPGSTPDQLQMLAP